MNDLYDFSKTITPAFDDVDDFDNIYNQLSRLGYVEAVAPEYNIQLTESGRKEYRKYRREEKGKRQENWPRRHWLLVAIISFVAGSIISPLVTKYIERKIWPEPNQSGKPTPIGTDTAVHALPRR